MFSLLTDLLSSLVLAPANQPEQSQDCDCQSLYPSLSRSVRQMQLLLLRPLKTGGQVDELCKSCGNLKTAGVVKIENVWDPFALECEFRLKRYQAPSSVPESPPRKPARVDSARIGPTERNAVRYINRKLEASLSFVSSAPVLICRNGQLTAFENGQSLHAYQAIDVQRMCDRERAGASTLLAYAMGLGKTVTSIGLICSNRSVAPNDFPTTLATSISPSVIAPSVGILQHWQAELKRFAPKLQVLLYHKEGRTNDPRLPDVVLLTLSEVRNQYAAFINEGISDVKIFPLYTGTFHRAIIDEAHIIRNPESASAKACWALKKSHGLCLTGTPAQNKLEDLHPLLKFLDIESKGLNHLATFNARVTVPYEAGEIVKATELLVGVLSECMIYRPKGAGLGVVELPKLNDAVIVAVELTPAEREVYRYMKFVHPFKSQWAKAVRLRQTVDHPGLLTKALHRGDIGPKPDETSDQMRVLLDESRADANEVIAEDLPLGALPASLAKHAAIFKSTYLSSKFVALWGILERIPVGEKVIIFSHLLTNLDMIADLLSKREMLYARYDGRMGPSERAEALDQIRNDKRCTVLLLSIMAGGTGLDIPACNHVILIEPWWNPYVEEQAISRVHRIGQVREVRVYKLLVKDSIEYSIVKTQNAKREVIGGLLSLCAVPDVDEMRKWLA
ncbi:P-loop containing nucleoside triphosphate hydrolase protein [Mycena latifolia]|nr:P-loop containing nucleoside triphosphate hydrolase protein [Mycena latifolia]